MNREIERSFAFTTLRRLSDGKVVPDVAIRNADGDRQLSVAQPPSAHDRDSYWGPARLPLPVSDDGLLGSLSLVGLVSLCCLGLGGLAAGAALAAGGAGTTVLATGATDARGALVSAVVTFLTVAVVALFVRWRLG